MSVEAKPVVEGLFEITVAATVTARVNDRVLFLVEGKQAGIFEMRNIPQEHADMLLGIACPQTVYTEIFMWIEQKIEGDRNRRMKLDKARMSPKKFAIKTAKYGAWIAISLWTGFTLVAYFTPMRELMASFASFSFGPWEIFWPLFYAGFTYLFAGILREQVCKYMCPYARFQSVMFDQDTLVITYDETRGEPRGARKKGVAPKSIGKGDCVDCGSCVQVCPTGIDMARMKIEVLAARATRLGTGRRERLIAALPRYAPVAARLAPLPPTSSGISMPITPSSKSRSIRSRGIFASSSILRTMGRLSRSANS